MESDDSILGDPNKKVKITALISKRSTAIKLDTAVEQKVKEKLQIQVAPSMLTDISIPIKKEVSLEKNLTDETPLR